VSLLGAAVASLCYIAPAAQHRILFRQGQKELLVRRSNRLGLVGGVALGVSMTAATLMVLGYLFDGPVPPVTAAGPALVGTWLWFVQPAITRWRAGA